MTTSQDTSATAPAVAPTTFLQRIKPRASARVQLVLAAAMWFIASLMLGIRGAIWLSANTWWLPLLVLGVAIGVLKARFLLDGVARKAADRIIDRGRSKCAGGFLAWKSWLLIGSMMAAGIALRHTAVPRVDLGVLYTAVGVALLVASRIYWSEAIRAA